MMTKYNQNENLSVINIEFGLDQAIKDAIISGERERHSDYRGFDFAVFTLTIEPLLKQAKDLPDYISDKGFRKRIDERERECHRALRKAGWLR